MDSTCSKESNDTFFVIFRCTVWKIWFSEDLNEIWFKFLFEFCFKTERATWRYGIHRYRFGWIRPEDHWILVDLGGQDQLIPLRVSDLLGALGSWLDGEKRKKREGVPRVRVESSPVRSAAGFQAPAMLRWVLGDGVTTMSFRTEWWPRSFDWHRRLFPDGGEGGDWSLALAQVTFGHGRLRRFCCR
jgi:hypothetical protein